jgi:uncharacterized membrane protein
MTSVGQELVFAGHGESRKLHKHRSSDARQTFHNTCYKSKRISELLFAVWLFISHYQFYIRGGRATIVHLALLSMFERSGCVKPYLGLAG